MTGDHDTITLRDAAQHFGMSVRTLEKVYAHHDPEHQDFAANLEPVPRHR